MFGCPRAYIEGENEGLRKCEDFGKLGCVTSITYTLPDGIYEWGVQAVDGRRVGSKFAKGTFTIGDQTGINEAKDTSPEASDKIHYDLQGRRVSKGYRGIVVSKEKKVVKK